MQVKTFKSCHQPGMVCSQALCSLSLFFFLFFFFFISSFSLATLHSQGYYLISKLFEDGGGAITRQLLIGPHKHGFGILCALLFLECGRICIVVDRHHACKGITYCFRPRDEIYLACVCTLLEIAVISLHSTWTKEKSHNEQQEEKNGRIYRIK